MKQLDYGDEVTLLLITVTTAVYVVSAYSVITYSLAPALMAELKYNFLSITVPGVFCVIPVHKPNYNIILSVILPVICLADKVQCGTQLKVQLMSTLLSGIYNHYSMSTNARTTFPPAIFTMGNQSMVQSKSLNGGNKINGKYLYS